LSSSSSVFSGDHPPPGEGKAPSMGCNLLSLVIGPSKAEEGTLIYLGSRSCLLGTGDFINISYKYNLFI